MHTLTRPAFINLWLADRAVFLRVGRLNLAFGLSPREAPARPWARAAVAVAACLLLAEPSPAHAAEFWLVELSAAPAPAVRYVDSFSTGRDCYEATFTHDVKVPGGFATCLATSEPAEDALADAINNYGTDDPCEAADKNPSKENVVACFARQR